TEGKVVAFVSIVGTGGSFGGVARTLKARNSLLKCYVVEPQSAPYLAKKPTTNPNHKIQGTGYMRDLPQIPAEFVDNFLTVSDEDAIATARELARREGIFGGFSSGANVAAALQLARVAEPDEIIVTLACDSGLKYLST